MLSRETAAPKRLFQLAYKPIAGLHLLVWSITLQALCLVLFKHSGFYFHVFVLRTLKVYHPTMKHGATKSKICSGLRHDLNDYCFPFGCPAHILIHFFLPLFLLLFSCIMSCHPSCVHIFGKFPSAVRIHTHGHTHALPGLHPLHHVSIAQWKMTCTICSHWVYLSLKDKPSLQSFISICSFLFLFLLW